jgi:hypothetical protein
MLRATPPKLFVSWSYTSNPFSKPKPPETPALPVNPAVR